MRMSTPAIETVDLYRRFGPVEAVRGISLEVRAGEIFGLLGPNGAGKTTTIQILTTLLPPTSGRARVAGFDVQAEPSAVRQRIGLVFQEPSLDLNLTGYENLRFHARLWGLPADAATRRIDELLTVVELVRRASDLVRTYSFGMRRRLEIARALVHSPDVLFLDEPTTGLDPQTRARVWDYIRTLRDREGTCILMTTHYIDEAEHCDRVAIIDEGRVVACDTPERLKRQLGSEVLRLHTDSPESLATDIEAAFTVPAQAVDNQVLIEHPDVAQLIPSLFGRFAGRITSVELRRPTLEDVFLKLTGRSLRSGER